MPFQFEVIVICFAEGETCLRYADKLQIVADYKRGDALAEALGITYRRLDGSIGGSDSQTTSVKQQTVHPSNRKWDQEWDIPIEIVKETK